MKQLGPSGTLGLAHSLAAPPLNSLGGNSFSPLLQAARRRQSLQIPVSLSPAASSPPWCYCSDRLIFIISLLAPETPCGSHLQLSYSLHGCGWSPHQEQAHETLCPSSLRVCSLGKDGRQRFAHKAPGPCIHSHRATKASSQCSPR